MLLDIVIPSKWRRNKLDNCLNSLFKSIHDEDVNIYLYFSVKEEYDIYYAIFKDIPNIKPVLLETEYRVPTFWNTHLQKMTADGLVYLNDDIEVFEDTIDKIKLEFYRYFPDYDGVIGLNQLNLNEFQKVEGAFGVIGRKYAERFPNKQVFCLDYYRFWGDFELMQHAKEIHKFHFSTEAQLIHNHPCTNRKFQDATHEDVRKYISKDKEIFNKRKEKGLLWGRTWDLINITERKDKQ
jgi:hypothetical protein